MVSRFEQFSFAISSIYSDIQKIEREEMIRYGLKGACAQYLIAMRRYPRGVTISELCEICDKDKAAVSRIAAEMESKGLIVRTQEGSVYRARLSLTKEGQRASDFVARRGQTAVETVGSFLTDENRTVLYDALSLIAKNLKELTERGLPPMAD